MILIFHTIATPFFHFTGWGKTFQY